MRVDSRETFLCAQHGLDEKVACQHLPLPMGLQPPLERRFHLYPAGVHPCGCTYNVHYAKPCPFKDEPPEIDQAMLSNPQLPDLTDAERDHAFRCFTEAGRRVAGKWIDDDLGDSGGPTTSSRRRA